ncbi:MAG: flagellar motor switch protein FliN [Brevinema sp.]
MSDSQLSQSELDALIQGTPIQNNSSDSFTEQEDAALNKFCLALGEARVPQIAGITNQNVVLSQANYISGPSTKIGEDILGSVVGVRNAVSGVITGEWISFAPESTIFNVAGTMLGIENATEVSEEMVGAIGEALSNGFASDTKILGEQLKGAITQVPSQASSFTAIGDLIPSTGSFTRLTFTYKVGEALVPFHVVIPMNVAKEIARILIPTPNPSINPTAAMNNSVPMQMAQFQQFGAPKPVEGIDNLTLLLDVPMRVTVELGRTRMTIKDILNLGAGSIVELEKLAGEPVDVLVNDKLIALGEVVVIDENFSIRVTKVVTPMERIFDRENLHGKGGI